MCFKYFQFPKAIEHHWTSELFTHMCEWNPMFYSFHSHVSPKSNAKVMVWCCMVQRRWDHLKSDPAIPKFSTEINQTSTIFMGHLQKSTIFMGHLQKSTIFMGYLQKSTIFMGYLQTSTIFMAYLHKITTSMGLYRSDWNHEFIWFYDLPFLWDWKHQFINMDLLRKINQYGNWWDMMSEGCISYFFGTSPKTPQLPRLIIMDPCELDFAAKQLEIPISDFLPQVSPGTS